MGDIVIYTNPGVLEHKKRDGMEADGCYCYWEMRLPKKIDDCKRIYFATKGEVRGSFKVFTMSWESDGIYGQIRFHSETWEPLGEQLGVKAFRGFRYKWW